MQNWSTRQNFDSDAECITIDNSLFDITPPEIVRVENRPLGVPPTGVDGEVLGIGSALGLTVIFDEAVLIDIDVGKTLKLTLNNGVELFYSGDPLPGNSVTFPYTIAEGDGDVDPVDVVSLVASAADVIEDAAGNDANTSLPGGTSDLFNQGIGVDSTRPEIDNLNSAHANGPFTIAEVIDIVVTFDDTITLVTTGGDPTLSLNNGATALFQSPAGASTITFRYTVAGPAGTEDVADLDAASATLNLNGATIQDAVTNDADLTTIPTGATAGSLATNKNIQIDTTSPVLTRAFDTALDGINGWHISQPIDIVWTCTDEVGGSGADPATLPNTPAVTVENGPSGVTHSGQTCDDFAGV